MLPMPDFDFNLDEILEEIFELIDAGKLDGMVPIWRRIPTETDENDTDPDNPDPDLPEGVYEISHFVKSLVFSETRNFHLDANPEIIGYRDPDNDPPGEILPLLEGETGQNYLPLKDGVQAVGRVHVIDEVVDKTHVWSIPDTDLNVISINQEGVISIPDHEELDPIYNMRLIADYNKIPREIYGKYVKLPQYMDFALYKTLFLRTSSGTSEGILEDFNLPGVFELSDSWTYAGNAFTSSKFVGNRQGTVKQ